MDYSYNIRGWLKSINDVTNLSTDLFAFQINYNDPENAENGSLGNIEVLFNGNISEISWITSKGNKSSTLATIIDKGISSSENYTLNLTGGKGDDKTVFIDSYTRSTVDVGDLKKLGDASTALQGAAIGHFLNEIQEVTGYSTASESTRESSFETAHSPSLTTEGAIYSELSGDTSVKERTNFATGEAVNGSQSVIYRYNSSNQFEIQQGATTVTKKTSMNIGGVTFPVNEITPTLIGELKSVKKI